MINEKDILTKQALLNLEYKEEKLKSQSLVPYLFHQKSELKELADKLTEIHRNFHLHGYGPRGIREVIVAVQKLNENRGNKFTVHNNMLCGTYEFYYYEYNFLILSSL